MTAESGRMSDSVVVHVQAGSVYTGPAAVERCPPGTAANAASGPVAEPFETADGAVKNPSGSAFQDAGDSLPTVSRSIRSS